MKAELVRLDKSSPEGIYGVLKIDDKVICLTLERPWEDNKQDISCIPENIYLCKKIKSPNFGTTFQIMDVYNRTLILFHIGNTIKDSKGCILLGSEFGRLKDKKAVLASRKAFKKFMNTLDSIDEFALVIRCV